MIKSGVLYSATKKQIHSRLRTNDSSTIVEAIDLLKGHFVCLYIYFLKFDWHAFAW